MITLKEIDLNKVTAFKTKERFYLPIETDNVINALGKAYVAEVQQRMTKREDVNCNMAPLIKIAVWATDKQGKPGLLLYGDIGTGKTTALRALCRIINSVCHAENDNDRLEDHGKEVVTVIRAKDVVDAYQNNKPYYEKMRRVPILAIDELGVEPIDVKLYGNSREPIIDLLSTRYDNQKVTIVTSNLDLQQVSERYGMRMADRFQEMFHKVAYTGPSFRGYANQQKK